MLTKSLLYGRIARGILLVANLAVAGVLSGMPTLTPTTTPMGKQSYVGGLVVSKRPTLFPHTCIHESAKVAQPAHARPKQ